MGTDKKPAGIVMLSKAKDPVERAEQNKHNPLIIRCPQNDRWVHPSVFIRAIRGKS
jgi:hypothetical protein